MDKGTKVIYVAGPITPINGGGVNEQYENIMEARRVAVELWEEGYTVICPHLNSAFMDGIISHEDWYKRSLIILERCDAVVLMKNWQSSTGTILENQKAVDLGVPVTEFGYPGWKMCLEIALRDREEKRLLKGFDKK